MTVDLPALRPLSLTGGSVDRGGQDRRREEWLQAALDSPRTRMIVVRDGKTLLDAAERPALARLVPAQVTGQVCAPENDVVWLGRSQGVDWVALGLPSDAVVELPGTRWAGLREVAALADPDEASLLAEAYGLLNWRSVTRFCPRCGTPLQARDAGWVLECPRDESEHFPRTDPAIIVLVTDAEDRVLLGSNTAWDRRRFALFAGFVEPGESLEEAVAREAGEEAGVHLGAPRYMGSQPWPFPASLMLGFHAQATDAYAHADGDEIAAVRWFTREELADAVRAGEVLIPGEVSISGALLRSWFGRDLPTAEGADS